MDEMPTLLSGGHIIDHGRPLHKSFRILLGTLSLWWDIEQEQFLRRLLVGGLTFRFSISRSIQNCYS